MEKLQTLKDILELTGASYSSVNRWMNAGEFPTPINGRGKKFFWAKSSIESWMNQQSTPVSVPIVTTPKRQTDAAFQAARAALERHRKTK